jgi:NAD(P)-dependent dehydrogenase (short-subunit alcohol dehydrogenase family)
MADARSSEIDLTGQVAIVTGGGRGIGRAIALGLASAGASAVAVVARSLDQIAETVGQITQAGGRAVAVPGDVSEPEAVGRMVPEVERALGPVDVLVNNAGIAGPLGPIAETEPVQWWRCQEVNLRGPRSAPGRCSQECSPGAGAGSSQTTA